MIIFLIRILNFLLTTLGLFMAASVMGLVTERYYEYNARKKHIMVSIVYSVFIFLAAFPKLMASDTEIMSAAPILLILLRFKHREIYLPLLTYLLGIYLSGSLLLSAILIVLTIIFIHYFVQNEGLSMFIQFIIVIPLAFSETLLRYQGETYEGRVIWSVGILLMMLIMAVGVLMFIRRKSRAAFLVREFSIRYHHMFDRITTFHIDRKHNKVHFSDKAMDLYELPQKEMSEEEFAKFMMETYEKGYQQDGLSKTEGFLMTPVLGEVRYIRTGQFRLLTGNRIGYIHNLTENISKEEILYFKTQRDSVTRFATHKVFAKKLFEESSSIAQSPQKGFLLVAVEMDTHAAGYSIYDVELETRIQRSLILRAKEQCSGMEVFSVIFGEYLFIVPYDAKNEDKSMLRERLEDSFQRPVEVDGKTISSFVRTGYLDIQASDIISYEDAQMCLDKILYCMTRLLKERTLTRYEFRDYEYESYLKKKRRVRALHTIILHEKISILFQPTVHLAEEKPLYFEVLTRVEHDAYENTRDFFSDLQEFSKNREVDRIIFKKLREALEKGEIPLYNYSVNISPETKIDENLIFVADYLDEHGYTLYLELIERTRYNQDYVEERNLFSKKHHAKLVADDFGIDYANMEMLYKYNFAALKIPRNFVVDIHKNEKNRIFAETIFQHCKRLGLLCVAEGVEAREEMETLKKMGILYAQGYYFRKPLNGADLLSLYGGVL